MSILNLLSTGHPVPLQVEYLKKAIGNREGGSDSSMYEYISVHCMMLAKVLDRLERLEIFLAKMKDTAKDIDIMF